MTVLAGKRLAKTKGLGKKDRSDTHNSGRVAQKCSSSRDRVEDRVNP
jgi:hypothetical protein